ncbi:MAG TPA: OmpA family protein [Blastocatellia bacterium]|nr:OmpA family protein [Blastocatellia bacterium]
MRSTRTINLLLALMTGVILMVPAVAQEENRSTTQTTGQSRDRVTTQSAQGQDQQNQTMNNEARTTRVASGQKQKFSGIIVKRNPDNIIIRDQSGADVTVNLTNSTKVTERKSNPFRRAKNYDTTALLRGLQVEVEGRGDNSGALNADKIKFTNDEYQVARSIESRVTPVEGRVTEAEGRLTAAEQNAQRLSGQIEELGQVTNTLKDNIKSVQNTAEAAMAGVNSTNERISMLDDYEAQQNTTVNFKVNSAVLSPEAKAALDQIATQAQTQKGFIIQVAGYASADGSEDRNRALSQRRADAVVRYLVENHNIPLRRIITPFGYGESHPVADNTTREGRQQNRRVEVAILVSKGLTGTTATNRPADTTNTQSTQRTSNVPPQQ